MKQFTLFVLTVAAAAMIAACGGDTKPAATAPPVAETKAPAGPPTKEALMAIEKGAYDAWQKKDSKYFEENLDENFVMFAGGKRMGKAASAQSIKSNPCTINSYSTSDALMTPAGKDAAILTSKVTQDVVCDGKKEPATLTATTVFRRSGDNWKIAFHNENAEGAKPKAASAPDAKADTKPAEETAKAAANDPGKKAETGVMALHTAAWDAWKARDAKRLGEWAADAMAYVAEDGKVLPTKAEAIKYWTDAKCDVKSVAVSEGTDVDLSPDAKLLLSKGTATGTCDGQQLTPVWEMAVYTKQGDAWKLTYLVGWHA